MRRIVLSLFILLNLACVMKMPTWIERPNPIPVPLPMPAVPVPHYRTAEQIEYEKAVIIRDYYKNRLNKIKHMNGVVATKDIEELEMNAKISELDLEKAEINYGSTNSN
jgi:hypothetical protein